MARESNDELITRTEDLALQWERAVHLNGAGARAIRDLTNALRNVDQAKQAMGLITDRYERLILEVDKLLQANLDFQKTMNMLYKRVLKLEHRDDDDDDGPSGSTDSASGR